jgi:DNA-binding HxlR family transcriptional regulator
MAETRARQVLSPFRSECPIARVLDVLGDRWSLLIIRDVLRDRQTFSKILDSNSEQIATNILAERLNRLVENGLLEKRPYQERPLRFEYLPTKRCKALKPVLRAIAKFGVDELNGKLPT